MILKKHSARGDGVFETVGRYASGHCRGSGQNVTDFPDSGSCTHAGHGSGRGYGEGGGDCHGRGYGCGCGYGAGYKLGRGVG